MRAYVKAQRITPTELARRLGYTPKGRSWGSDFLRGERGLTPDRLDQVAALMGLAVPALFTPNSRLLSQEAIAVATAYDECRDEKTRSIVQVALALPAQSREEVPPHRRARAGHG